MDQATRLKYALYPDALIDVLIERRSCYSSMSLPLGSLCLSNERLDLQKGRGITNCADIRSKDIEHL